jgi:hypothetical protein
MKKIFCLSVVVILSTAACSKNNNAGDNSQGPRPSVDVSSPKTKGNEQGNGGDIQCDALIKKYASNLEQWIEGNGPEVGKLDLSSSLNPATNHPYTYPEYNAGMLSLLKLPLDVSCVSSGDPSFPVSVDDSTKVCKSFVDKAGMHMTCDRALFLGLDADPEVRADLQIEQNHHEFATQVPGLEPDTGPISTYKISVQLSNSIETVKERKLVVKAPNTNSPPACNPRLRGIYTYYAGDGSFGRIVIQAPDGTESGSKFLVDTFFGKNGKVTSRDHLELIIDGAVFDQVNIRELLSQCSGIAGTELIYTICGEGTKVCGAPYNTHKIVLTSVDKIVFEGIEYTRVPL